MKQVVTDKAPQAPAMMSQAIVSGDTIYVAGQIHADLEWKLVGETVAEKVEQIMKNISAILEATNSSLENVVKVVIYLTDMEQLKELNGVYPKYFTQPYPVREAVGVSALPLGASIEISVIAESQ
jgi:2-iminobutanoate/2-iminopropanoate deaminase